MAHSDRYFRNDFPEGKVNLPCPGQDMVLKCSECFSNSLKSVVNSKITQKHIFATMGFTNYPKNKAEPAGTKKLCERWRKSIDIVRPVLMVENDAIHDETS